MAMTLVLQKNDNTTEVLRNILSFDFENGCISAFSFVGHHERPNVKSISVKDNTNGKADASN